MLLSKCHLPPDLKEYRQEPDYVDGISEISAVFLDGQAFVCFVLILAVLFDSVCGFRKFNDAHF